MDTFFALILLLVLSPVLVLSALAIKVNSLGPVFFFQVRAGKQGKPFHIIKLRTMTNKKRKVDREILKGNPEVTAVGKLLRRLKIDELTQLINILKGDMSFVGPRPSMLKQMEMFDENGKYRLKVRPGLTGLAQVNGNIYLSWPERWKYDRAYVENQSLLLDIKILLKTVLVVVVGEAKFLDRKKIDS